ncbi:MAG: hypothetical protein OXH69_04835 [Acidobacteria bacterium]|nr:hypothetical protein [Acidobacteriota bacterium]
MIGYRVGRRTLKRLIRQHDPDWLRKAENGDQPDWGDIKDVFVRIQHYKCGYCERLMPRPQRPAGDGTTGAIWGGRREYDVDHFRPKRQVRRWPTAESGFRYAFETGDFMAGGYPWLSHDFLNYLASCKTCNQDNKKTYFPVAGRRGGAGDDVPRLDRLERPLLVNPVGAGDSKPEDLIGFSGFLAVPRGSRGHRRRRGTILIDLLGLNLRDELILQRCNLILAMWPYLERRREGQGGDRNDAAREIERLTSEASQHANCARCFEALHTSDLAAARRCYEAARMRSERLLRTAPLPAD